MVDSLKVDDDTVMQSGEQRQTGRTRADEAFTPPDEPRIIRFCA
jgi:hypothetical protein